MESKIFPIILRCQNITVAIPIKTLIEESTIFKTLYESVEHNSSASSDSGRYSGCSLQSIDQDLLSDDSNAGIDKPDCDEENSIESSKVEKTGVKEHQITEETNKYQQNQRLIQQFDTIDLSKFNGKSVSILFNSIQEHPELIDTCNNLSDLYGALKICDEYGISRPISQISTRFKGCDTITMVNLIETMEIAADIEKMKNYENISNGLIQRCVSFARWNFASWQIVLKLITEKKDKAHLVIRILKKLRDDSEAIIRFKVNNFSQFADSKTSSTFIIRNLEWKIIVNKITKSQDKRVIGVKIQCKNPNRDNGWYCDAKIEVRIRNHKTQEDAYEREVEKNFKNGVEDVIFTELETVQSVLNYSNGYIKDDQVVFEAKISVDYVGWMSESLGVSEKEMGWYEKKIKDSITHTPELQGLNLDQIEDSPVIFSCEKTLVAVHKFVLIKESSVFQAMFTGPWTRSDESNSKDENIKVIELTGYNQLSVKILFEYLKGYSSLLQDCKDLAVIGDMIKLCDFYNINRPVPELLAKLSNLQINMKNVVKAFEVSRSLEMIVAYKDLSVNLSSNCISYLRFNLASWQVLNNFLVNNNSKIELVLKMLEMLVQAEEANIRFKATEITQEKLNIVTPTFIHRNVLWQFSIPNKENVNKQGFVGCCLWHKNLEENTNLQKCRVKFVVQFHKMPIWEAAKTYKSSYSSFNANQGLGMNELINKDEFMNVDNGYLKDGCSYFEFDLNACLPTGIPESMGVTEEMII